MHKCFLFEYVKSIVVFNFMLHCFVSQCVNTNALVTGSFGHEFCFRYMGVRRGRPARVLFSFACLCVDAAYFVDT